MTVRFEFGDTAAVEAIERWWAGENPETVLRDNVRRRVVRVDSETGPLLLKQFRVGSGQHPGRERFKAWLGIGPASKETRALGDLRAAGVSVPEPLALARLPGGDRVLALPFIEATSTYDFLDHSDDATRQRGLERLADTIRAFHATGLTHRDLHHGNVLFAKDQVVVIDLQNARREAGREARLRDLAAFVFSLRERLTEEETTRLARRALGEPGADGEPLRPELRAAFERAFAERARDYASGRTRRAMRSGRRFAPWRRPSGRGLRNRAIEADQLERWLEAHATGSGAVTIKREGRVAISRIDDAGGRGVIVKESRAGVVRALADRVRGSAGRRAWRAGHGLAARRIRAAEPLAYADRTVLGLPVASVVVLEAVDGADGVEASGRPGVLDAQLELVAGLHRLGIDHGDLKASNWIHRADDQAAVLIDLEGVRFERELGDERRIEALAQWNASLPESVPDDARRRIFDAYAEALPFAAGAAEALREVVRRSLARDHRWKGGRCATDDAAGAPVARRDRP